MSCGKCGRPSGHHLGCPKIDAPAAPESTDDQCAREDCTEPRAPQGKGPRPKFCIKHKTGSK